MDPMETTPQEGVQCVDCEAHSAEKKANEEVSMAFLLALLPVMVLTFFGQVGLLR